MKTKRRQHKRAKCRRGGGPHTKQTTLSMGQMSLPPKSKSTKRTKVKTPKLTKLDIYLNEEQTKHEKKEAQQHLRYLDQAVNILNSTGVLMHAKIPSPIYKVRKYPLEFIKDPISGEREEYTLAEVKKLAEQQKHKPYLHPTRDFPYMGQDFNTPRPKSKSHY